MPTEMYALIVLGLIAAIAVVFAILYFCCWGKRKNTNADAETEGEYDERLSVILPLPKPRRGEGEVDDDMDVTQREGDGGYTRFSCEMHDETTCRSSDYSSKEPKHSESDFTPAITPSSKEETANTQKSPMVMFEAPPPYEQTATSGEKTPTRMVSMKIPTESTATTRSTVTQVSAGYTPRRKTRKADVSPVPAKSPGQTGRSPSRGSRKRSTSGESRGERSPEEAARILLGSGESGGNVETQTTQDATISINRSAEGNFDSSTHTPTMPAGEIRSEADVSFYGDAAGHTPRNGSPTSSTTNVTTGSTAVAPSGTNSSRMMSFDPHTNETI